MPAQDRVAHEIMIFLPIIAVLTAVNLDHNSARKAGEVEVVASEGRLPPNVKAALA